MHESNVAVSERWTHIQWSGKHWRASTNDAKVLAALMDDSLYPVDDESETKRVRTTVRLPKEMHERIEFVTRLWDAFDGALGKEDAPKWKANSVIERFVEAGLAKFAAQIGGWPTSKSEEDSMVAQAAELVAKLKATKPKKK